MKHHGSGRLTRIAALALAVAGASAAFAQSYTVPPALQAKIDSHPHVRKLTDWGSRAEWSADSKRLIFVSREFGDAFEVDVATGRTRPLTFHFSHDGVLRAYYLPNGDILLSAPRDHTPGADRFGRFHQGELWLMKGDLSGPAMPLNQRNMEGVAVSRSAARIAWAAPVGELPKVKLDGEMEGDLTSMGEQRNQIWMADIGGTATAPALVNKRLLLDCGATSGPLATLAAAENHRCLLIEPQNFVPQADDRLVFNMLSSNLKTKGQIDISAYTLDLKTGKIARLMTNDTYAEPEGIFPDGKTTLIEHAATTDILKAVRSLDLWQLALDGSAKMKRVTRYNELDPELKSNQGVVSPDGRWMAFGVSTAEIEKKVAGQGIGIFLMDLKAAGF